jgi:hypothetical protein
MVPASLVAHCSHCLIKHDRATIEEAGHGALVEVLAENRGVGKPDRLDDLRMRRRPCTNPTKTTSDAKLLASVAWASVPH